MDDSLLRIAIDNEDKYNFSTNLNMTKVFIFFSSQILAQNLTHRKIILLLTLLQRKMNL